MGVMPVSEHVHKDEKNHEEKREKKRVRIFTDGSCDTGSGEGGWGYLLMCNGARCTASGYEGGTTNNRMELTAAVRALSALKEPWRGDAGDRLAVSQKGFHGGLA